jgi:2-polyprenyl-6-methoxyphenol hydroxylase-like FAD-dependent oxidoreductase
MARGRAIVVGGGVGGLTAAVALSREGWDVTVHERRGSSDEITFGAGLGIWTNGIKALRQLGLDESVEQAGTNLERFDQLNWEGKRIASWAVGDIARELGAPIVDISRSALVRVLGEAVGDALRLGVSFIGLQQDHDGVTARFDDGSEERADLLIGADGINSTVRRELFGEIPPSFRGYTAYRGLVRFEHTLAPPHAFQQWWGRGVRLASYHVDDASRMFWMVVANARPGGTDPSPKDRAASLFAGCAEPVPSIIAATAPSEVQRHDVYDLDPLPQWGSGRVTLLGDAAHAMTFNVGQGACQAIEDAVALGKRLRSGDVPGSLRDYETGRRGHVKSLVMLARRIGSLGTWENPLACAARDRLIWPLLLGPFGIRGTRATMAHEI